MKLGLRSVATSIEREDSDAYIKVDVVPEDRALIGDFNKLYERRQKCISEFLNLAKSY